MKSFSASKIADWRLCARKGFLRHVLRVPSPPHPSAELGSAVHAVVERALKTGAGVDPAAGRAEALAARLLATLPPQRMFASPGNVERRFALRTENVAWSGVVDLYVPGAIPVVRDWKTSGDPRRYGKTAEDLHEDPQAMLYAFAASAWELERGRFPGHVRLQWAYVCTGGRSGRGVGKTHVVETTVAMRDVADRVDALDAEAQKIVRLGLAPEDEPKHKQNPGACGAFGGCAYRGRCWGSGPGGANKQAINGFALGGDASKEQQVGYLEDLKRKQAAKATKTEKSAGSRDPVNPPEKPAHASAADVNQISKRALPRIGLPDGEIPEADAERWQGEQRDKACAWLAEIVAAKDDDAIGALFDSCPLALQGWLDRQAKEAAEAGDAEEPPKEEPAPEKPKARRKRKSRDDLDAKSAPPASIEATEAAGLRQTRRNGENPGLVDRGDGAIVQTGIGTLFVDCMPSYVGDGPTRAADIVASLEPIGSAPHYRLEEYGRGPALAELAVSDHLATTHYPAVVIDSASTVGRDLLGVFERAARCVVRGLR